MKHLSLALLIVSIGLLIGGCATNTKNREAMGEFPVYGNWCGPSHPTDGKNPSPVDEVDAACMRHDHCYAKEGYFSCSCDSKLLVELHNLKHSKWQGRKQVTGEEYDTFEKPIVTAIKTYFAASPCAGLPNLPVKAVTGVDSTYEGVGKSAVFVIDKVYFAIQLPFLLVAKGLCAVVDTPSCWRVDERIESGQGVDVIYQRQ